LPALVAALGRFDERCAEEAAAVTSLLSVFENLVEISPVLRDQMLLGAGGGSLLRWLLARLTRKGPVDGNKVYAAELLAVILAGSDAAAQALGDGGGVDALLRAIAPYKRAKAGKEREKDKGTGHDDADEDMARHLSS
jgi:beta-catenin-like protein 1